MDDGFAHACSVAVGCSADAALALLSAPEELASWAAGMGETTIHGDGAVEGAFPGTGQPIWARIAVDPDHHAIYYHLGPDRSTLVPRIMIRIIPGRFVDGDPHGCVVSLLAWRQAGMDDARWQGLKDGHEREVLEIRRLLERDAAG